MARCPDAVLAACMGMSAWACHADNTDTEKWVRAVWLLQEDVEVPYRSRHAGRMHACAPLLLRGPPAVSSFEKTAAFCGNSREQLGAFFLNEVLIVDIMLQVDMTHIQQCCLEVGAKLFAQYICLHPISILYRCIRLSHAGAFSKDKQRFRCSCKFGKLITDVGMGCRPCSSHSLRCSVWTSFCVACSCKAAQGHGGQPVRHSAAHLPACRGGTGWGQACGGVGHAEWRDGRAWPASVAWPVVRCLCIAGKGHHPAAGNPL